MASIYTLVPRPNYDFAGLDITARYAFGMLYDRWCLSKMPENKARFTDNYGIYCLYSRRALAADMGVSLPTLRKAIRALEERDLVWTRVANYGDSVRYYITKRALDCLEAVDGVPLYHLNPGFWAEKAAEYNAWKEKQNESG